MDDLRAQLEAKIKAVMYRLIADTYDMEGAELERTEKHMEHLLEMQKDD